LALIRKIVIALVGVLLALLVTVLLLNPDSLLVFATSLSDSSIFVRLPLTILLDAVIMAVVVVVVRGARASHSTTGLMVKAQGAITDVSIESARDRILRAVRDVPDVLSAAATVRAMRGKADVELEVVVSHESDDLPEKQREIDRALRQVINKQLGLQMAGKPRVHLRMDDEQPELLTPPAPPPAPAPVEVVEAVEPVEPIVPESSPEPEAADGDGVPVAVSDIPEAVIVPDDDEPPADLPDLPLLP
jgi:hypothetical protein